MTDEGRGLRFEGFWFLVSGFWFLVSGFWFLVEGWTACSRRERRTRPDSGLGVEGTGLRVWDSGFRVQGSGFRVQGSGFRVQVLDIYPTREGHDHCERGEHHLIQGSRCTV